MSAFVRMAFAITIGTVGDVTQFFSISFGALKLRPYISGVVGEIEVDSVSASKVLGRGTVVAGENDKSIFTKLKSFDGGKEFADVGVELLNVVSVEPSLTATSELSSGSDVGMRSTGGEVEEEGIFSLSLDESDGLLSESGINPVSYTHLTLPTTPYV